MAAVERKGRIEAPFGRAGGAPGEIGFPFGPDRGPQGGVAGELKARARLSYGFGAAQEQAGGGAGAVEREAVDQRGAFEPGDELDEAEAVHRRAFVPPAVERGAERFVDRLAIGLGLERGKIDAD